jgi:hypothetical protein
VLQSEERWTRGEIRQAFFSLTALRDLRVRIGAEANTIVVAHP